MKSKLLKKMTSKQRVRFIAALRERTARCAKEDLFFLAKYVLGADRLKSGRSKFDHHHEKLCEDLMLMFRQRFDGMKQGYVVQWPRGSLKSTIVTTAFPIWCYLQDPNVRILVECESARKAERFLGAIKSYFQAPFFQELFGKLYNPKVGWSADALLCSRTAEGLKEPTFDSGGIEKDKTGNHYDLIVADDIVGETNSKTIYQIQKVNDHAALYLPLLDSEGLLVHSMTRWAFNDVGDTVFEENEQAKKECRPAPYVINRLSSYKESTEGKMTDELEFPLLHTKTYLLQMLAILKPYQFSCQYLLRPQSPSDASFRKEWIRYIGEHCDDIPIGVVPEGCKCYIAVDPALAQKEGSDYTAIVVAAVKSDYTIYILDIYRERYTKKEIYDKLVDLNALYKPSQIGIEAVFKMKEVLLYIKMQAQVNGVVLPLKTFDTQNKNKGSRIMGLQPLVQAGKFFMRRRVGDFIYLEDQMLKFDPKRINAQENDVLDSCAYFVELMTPEAQSEAVPFYMKENWMLELMQKNEELKAAGQPLKKIPSYGLVRSLMHNARTKVKRMDVGGYVPLSRFKLS